MSYYGFVVAVLFFNCCLQQLVTGFSPSRLSLEGNDNDGEGNSGRAKPEVQTANGVVRGKVLTTKSGKEVYVFYGIPYAKPPIGNLRFRPPIPIGNWQKPFDAFTKPNSCSQTATPGVFHNFTGDAVWYANTPISEDCLYLNIWVPPSIFHGNRSRVQDNSPVLFWIHGGAMFFGTSTSDVFQAHNLVAEENVIAVSTQYRLGPLGFMYFGTEDVPGNVGLLDQNLALKWISENIRAFGGNPDKITIFGESAGGASVEYHLLSPMSYALFNSGIILSGTYTSRFNPPDEALNNSITLAQDVGCGNFNDKPHAEVTACLREVPHDKLYESQFLHYNKKMRSPFVATVDGTFLSDTPINLLNNKDFSVKRANIIIGDTKNEGPFFMPWSFPKYRDPVNPVFVSYNEFLNEMNELFKDRPQYERLAILQEYTNWVNLDDGYENQKRIGEAVGDGFLLCPSRYFADKWSSFGFNVFYYSFSQRTSSSPWAEWFGVRHTDEIEYVFGTVLDDGKHTQEEIALSKQVMKLFANFARTASPSPNWLTYTQTRPLYMELNATSNFITNPNVFGPRAEFCAFWNNYLPALRQEVGRIQEQTSTIAVATAGGAAVGPTSNLLLII